MKIKKRFKLNESASINLSLISSEFLCIHSCVITVYLCIHYITVNKPYYYKDSAIQLFKIYPSFFLLQILNIPYDLPAVCYFYECLR